MVRVVQVPFGGGGLGHGDGARDGPQAILDAFAECYADEYGNSVHDAVAVDDTAVDESHESIHQAAAQAAAPTIFLGGDHSVTAPLVRGTSPDSLVVFDAHPDVVDDFEPPSQEDYLRVLLAGQTLEAKNVFLIGLRNWDAAEKQYLDEQDVNYYTMREVFSRGIDAVMQDVVSALDGEVYVSVDIDAVDPVEAIGTGYTEHGGMSSRELIHALQVLVDAGVSFADIVEVNPSRDVNGITAALGAKLLAELSRI